MVVALVRAIQPFFSDLHTFGFHDWDAHAAYRYITVLALRHGEGPWWDPYMSGGYPAWGYVEGATNFVSPYLPVYLLFPIQVALRIETFGSAATALAGAYLLASRFTRSTALCALVAVLFALNGRWALQMTAGHTWHMRYALLPWVFWLYDIALEPKKLRWAVYAGMAMALIVYMGGVYPAPHTALLLGIYGLVRAALERTTRPLTALAILGLTAFGFAAPKLLPVADTMRQTPRIISSPEAIDLHQVIVMMTEHDQPFYGKPVSVPIHGWHEYGIYVGWVGVAVLTIGALFARGPRAQAVRLAGLFALLLGLGSFHPYAPWAQLHQLPMFGSQWVPSRYLYPMTLFLGLAFVMAVGRHFDQWVVRRRWLDWLALLPVLAYALDLAAVDRETMGIAFHLQKPVEIPVSSEFHQEWRSPFQYQNPDPHAESVLLAMFANVGVVAAYGTPLFEGGSAIPKGSPAYRGEAHIEQGTGEAHIVRWTPNSATVEVSGASAGALVVYNQNWDPSWKADGRPALESDHLVAAPAPAGGSGRIVFRYYPRWLNAGLGIFLLTALLAFGAPRAPQLMRKLRAR
jgi:hypothetical protein